ncbi:uncharacterized protein G2W53_026543 [Senna tora]|uniref:Uncharacterized protein n=1 Tax=Senna tora TaxID=362788 RepID=A0A834WHI5_9FABA|nr:uncharacterized protein G2W53_037338 [Senna tora]KAF7821088.1 uncharacterized protein G2W53_026543 [Senna tora]
MRKKKSIREEIVPDFSHGAIFSPVRSHLHGAGVNAPSDGVVATPLSHSFEFKRQRRVLSSASLSNKN